MAYIPDEACDDASEVSASAFKIYAYVCRRRNHQKQFAYINIDDLTMRLDIGKSTVYEAVKELERKNWLRREQYAWCPIKGDFWPVDRKWHGQK